jgi:AcrR family transcriptional regulator
MSVYLGEMRKSGNTPKKAAAPRGRGRPRAFDREAALTQATRVFWTKGYEATSIADLKEAMGIESPSLYAAFGSKEALYTEALHHYGKSYEAFVWGGFFSSRTAREAVTMFLMDSAAALTGSLSDTPHGCMVVLSSVASEGHSELGKLVRSARAITHKRLKDRLKKGIAEGELPKSTDVDAVARFIQSVQSGMSILARDGASRLELEAVARMAMLGWKGH